MNVDLPVATASADSETLIQIRSYLTDRKRGLLPSKELEAAWIEFYDLYSRTIRAYAFTCGATEEEVTDCVQEVWRALLARLQWFELDRRRGQFDTWLFSVVQSKTADSHDFLTIVVTTQCCRNETRGKGAGQECERGLSDRSRVSGAAWAGLQTISIKSKLGTASAGEGLGGFSLALVADYSF